MIIIPSMITLHFLQLLSIIIYYYYYYDYYDYCYYYYMTSCHWCFFSREAQRLAPNGPNKIVVAMGHAMLALISWWPPLEGATLGWKKLVQSHPFQELPPDERAQHV